MNIAELRARIGALAQEQAKAAEAHPDHDYPADVLEQMKSRNTEIESLSADFKRLQENEKLAAAARTLHEQFSTPASRPPFPTGDDGDTPKSRASGLVVAKSFGQRFSESDEWKAWMALVAPNGVLSEKSRFTSPAVAFNGAGFGRKTVITGGSVTSGGAMVWPDVQAGLVSLPFSPLTLRDLITNSQTGSDTVEFARVTTLTNNAATVAESTTITVGDTGIKPESAMALEKVTAPVKTIAHWIPATKRALADASQLRTLIDAFLMDGLQQELEDQMINGNTVGEDFTGIANTANVQSQAFSTDLLTTLRKARTLVKTVGFDTPNAYLMHPNDWEDIDLLQDNEARYFFGGPREMGQPRLWGLPVVESTKVVEGTAYVGNFKQCVLWDREQASIQVSDQNADFFVRNLIAILAEMRAAFGILRPKSIVEIALS